MSFKQAASLNRLTLQLGSLMLLIAPTFIQAQVVRLRDPVLRPEFFLGSRNQNAPSNAPTRPASAQQGPFKNERPPASIKNPRPPKPGNVIVRFGPDHEINRLEYVMPDGRLATVYTRNHPVSSERGVSRAVQRQTVPTDGQRLLERLEKAQQAQQAAAHSQNGRAQTTAQPPLAHLQPLQQTNAQQVKQTVATIELDTNEFEEAGELDEQDAGSDGTGEMLATIAGSIIRQGYQANAGTLLKAKKLISKVKSKFARLPQLIDAKLRAKSSLGRIFLDHATGSIEQQAGGSQTPISQYAYRDLGAGSTLRHRQHAPPSQFQKHQTLANANNAPSETMTVKEDLATGQ